MTKKKLNSIESFVFVVFVLADLDKTVAKVSIIISSVLLLSSGVICASLVIDDAFLVYLLKSSHIFVTILYFYSSRTSDLENINPKELFESFNKRLFQLVAKTRFSSIPLENRNTAL